jgi:hypothetical protein
MGERAVKQLGIGELVADAGFELGVTPGALAHCAVRGRRQRAGVVV